MSLAVGRWTRSGRTPHGLRRRAPVEGEYPMCARVPLRRRHTGTPPPIGSSGEDAMAREARGRGRRAREARRGRADAAAHGRRQRRTGGVSGGAGGVSGGAGRSRAATA
ncbi:hypothetical protein ACFFRL_19500 [Agromyces hippuratus]|uniref:hypothetical protein n=1 Tax=Agromyces hippuratus TaxID=286438 RepID=UPI0035ED1307